MYGSEQPATPPPAPRSLLRRPLVLAGAAVLALVLGVVLTLALRPGQASFTAHGTETVCVDAADITDGSQVTVTDSAGHVIGSGTLSADNSAATAQIIKDYDQLQATLSLFGGTGPGMSVYDFTVTALPGGLPRYGILIGQGRGTIWFTQAEMKARPGLNLGC